MSIKTRTVSMIAAAVWAVLPGGPARAADETARQVAVDHVKAAIEYMKAHGKDAVIAEVNKGKFKDGDVYVTVFDLEGKCLAQPVRPALVGNNMMNARDGDGVYYVKERIEGVKAKGSVWQSYKFPNPVTKKMERKEVYNEVYEGIIFACGVYEKK